MGKEFLEVSFLKTLGKERIDEICNEQNLSDREKEIVYNYLKWCTCQTKNINSHLKRVVEKISKEPNSYQIMLTVAKITSEYIKVRVKENSKKIDSRKAGL